MFTFKREAQITAAIFVVQMIALLIVRLLAHWRFR
jgi:hypothetical protein